MLWHNLIGLDRRYWLVVALATAVAAQHQDRLAELVADPLLRR
jgi:hypothetical protein